MRLTLVFLVASFAVNLFTGGRADACRRCRQNFVVRQQVIAPAVIQRQVIHPFAIPVGIPVARSSFGLGYSYSDYGSHQNIYGALTADEMADKIAERILERFGQVEGLRAAGFRASPIAQHCGKCHSGTAPKGGISLSASFLTPGRRYAATRAVMTGKMPKGKVLSDAERSAVIHDLLELEAAPAVEVPLPPQ